MKWFRHNLLAGLFGATVTIIANQVSSAQLQPTTASEPTDSSLSLSTEDRQQLEQCVSNLIAGKSVVRVNIRGHDFSCDYARSQGFSPRSTEKYGFDSRNAVFRGRISHHGNDVEHRNRLIEVIFKSDGDVRLLRLFTMFPDAKRETRIALSNAIGLLPPSEWYADKLSNGACAFRSTDWQGTANLIATTVAVRLSQSFKHALATRKSAEPVRNFVNVDGESIVRRGGASPILWGVVLFGKSFASKKHLPSLTHAQCAAACQNSRCVGWSFRSAETTASGRPINAQCRLFDTVDTMAARNKYVSALKPGAFVESAEPADRTGNVCGRLHRDKNGKIVRTRNRCKPNPKPFLMPGRTAESCSPMRNTCQSYDPPHPVDVIGGDC